MDNKNRLFNERVESGQKLMGSSSVVICGLVRNCEDSLLRNIPITEKLRTYFKESHVIIIENDSTDKTKSILKDWESKTDNIIISSEDYGTQTIPDSNNLHPKGRFFSKNRIEKMAKYRNMYLDIIKEKLNPDFVIMIDLDIYRFDLDGVLNSFGFKSDWHCISANGRKITMQSPIWPIFYDTYAFKEYDDYSPTTYEEIIINQKKLAKLKKKGPFLRVNSGFNGLAIYKWDSIKKLSYKVESNDDDIVSCKCEHQTFHEEMIKNGHNQIYINPSMIVHYEQINVMLYLQKMKKKLLFK